MSSAPDSSPTYLQSRISREMARGDYASPDDLLCRALVYWSEHRETEFALDQALDEIDAGLGRPWEEVDREFRQQNGLPLDS